MLSSAIPKKLTFSKVDYGHEVRIVSNEKLGKEIKAIYEESLSKKETTKEMEIIFPSNELDFTKVSKIPFDSFFFKIKKHLIYLQFFCHLKVLELYFAPQICQLISYSR